MTPHLLFFLADCAAFLLAGIYIGIKLYPKRNADIYDKLPFIAGTTFTSTTGGLFYTLDKGLPEFGFALANFFFAVIITLTVLWIFNAHFRKKYSRKANTIYVNYIKSHVVKVPRLQYPNVIRLT